MKVPRRGASPSWEGAERREGERGEGRGSEPPRSGDPSQLARDREGPQTPDPEVLERPQRRRFTAEYKLRILQQADACEAPCDVGALLRREGLYSSLVSSWRRQREAGALSGLEPKKRGRKPKPRNPLQPRVAELERENQRLSEQLEQAQAIIEVQEKLSEVLRVTPHTPSERD